MTQATLTPTMSKSRSAEKFRSRKWTFVTYIQCYFITIATILGTGVFDMPISLTHSGIYPFIVAFIFSFLAQCLLALCLTDVLQRAYIVQLEAVREYGREENVPLYAIVDGDDHQEDDIAIEVKACDGSVLEDLAGHVILPAEDTVKSPNLHMLADFFLGCGVKQAFHLTLILSFVAALVSYVLTGSQVYAHILDISPTYVMPVLAWTLTAAIVFSFKLIQPVVSCMTFINASVLFIAAVVAFIPGRRINNTIHNDFSHIGQPFLAGTVALGGLYQTMPMMYEKIKPSIKQVRNYRRAVITGLATCAVLNVLWCWAVLMSVPQESGLCVPPSHDRSVHSQSMSLACRHNISLETAAELGQISTVPLMRIIESYFPRYAWIAVLAQAFLTVGATSSYLTIGAAMHHTLCGWVESYWTHDRFTAYQAKLHIHSHQLFRQCNTQLVCSSFLSMLVFAVVFTVAMISPEAFRVVLDRFTSVTVNLHSGVFMYLMVRKATSDSGYAYLDIPLPLPRLFHYLQLGLPLYFGLAIGYDIYTIISDVTS